MNQIAAMPKAGDAVSNLLDRALLTAHLLTGNLQQAEEVTLDAIDSWRPGEDEEEVLFQNVLSAASRVPVEPNSSHLDPASSYMPHELKSVLRLSPRLRSCFVLHILAGLPAQACARLLGLHSDMVERYTCDALRCLAHVT